MSGIVGGIIGVVIGAAGIWAGISAGVVPAPGGMSFGGETSNEKSAGDAAAVDRPPAPATAPAYLIVIGDVHDREAFISGYAQKMPPIYAKYGGEYLAVGRNREILEGDADFGSYVISKWPSMDAARTFWDSPEYAPLKQARVENNWGAFDVFLVEGAPAAGPPVK